MQEFMIKSAASNTSSTAEVTFLSIDN